MSPSKRVKKVKAWVLVERGDNEIPCDVEALYATRPQPAFRWLHAVRLEVTIKRLPRARHAK